MTVVPDKIILEKLSRLRSPSDNSSSVTKMVSASDFAQEFVWDLVEVMNANWRRYSRFLDEREHVIDIMDVTISAFFAGTVSSKTSLGLCMMSALRRTEFAMEIEFDENEFRKSLDYRVLQSVLDEFFDEIDPLKLDFGSDEE